MRKVVFYIFFMCIGILYSNAATISVYPGDNLNTKINSASGGDIVLVKPGTYYQSIKIENKNFSSSNPVIVKKDGTGTVLINGSSWIQLDIINCSYWVFEGLKIDKQNANSAGIWIKDSDHIIIKNSVITRVGQAGIHVNTSSYIDIIDNEISYTGKTQPAYGEGIYVGSGSTSAPFPDRNDYIWIEGNEIFECAYGEGINIKSEVFHCTVKGNTVHHIHPSTTTQLNQAAISINDANLSVRNSYYLNTSRDVWVENNTVYSVSGGQRSGWNNGIFFGGTGVYVLNNTVYNCADYGIIGHKWNNLGIQNYVYGNTTYSNGTNVSIDLILSVSYSNPGNNPNSKQTWYGGGSGDSQAPSVPANLSANNLNMTSFTLNWNPSSDNVGVTAYEVFKDGSSLGTTSTTSMNVTGLIPGASFQMKVRARDAAGNWSAQSSALNVTTTSDGSVLSNESWQSFPVSVQSGTFSATFDVVPNNANMNGIVGILNGTASDWDDLACMIRFYTNGKIEARDGDVYTADQNLYYSSGVNYSCRFEINIPSHTYSVFVTPQGQSEIALASNYFFRTSQQSVGQLNAWALKSTEGSLMVKNMSFNTSSVAVTGVALNSTSVSLTEGASQTLYATVSPANASNKNVSWSSNNTSVATVSSSGLVNAVSQGTANITVTTQDGNKTAVCNVTVVASGGGSETLTVNPAHDAYVRDNNTADGSGTDLVLKKAYAGTGYTRESYLKFDLTAEAVTSVGLAKLRLYCKQDDGGNAQLYQVTDDNWTETGITWGTKPASGSLIGSKPGSPGYMEWDVTSFVNNELSGNRIISFKIVSDADAFIIFNSKEAATNKPELIVESEGGAVVSDNLLLNPGWEDGNANWTIQSPFSLTSEDSHSGSNAVKLVGTSSWKNNYQVVNVTQNTWYILSAYIKGTAPVHFKIFKSDWSASLGAITHIPGSAWSACQLSFNSGNNSQILVDFQDAGSGITYIDDAELIVDPSKSVFLSMAEMETIKFDIEVFPNPVDGNNLNIHINKNPDESCVLLIADISGRIIVKQSSIKNNSVTINMENNCKPGVYVVKVLLDSGMAITKKLIVR